MKISEFIRVCENVSNSKTNNGQAKTYFTSIYVGYHYPSMQPPNADEIAKRGFKIGNQLRKTEKPSSDDDNWTAEIFK